MYSKISCICITTITQAIFGIELQQLYCDISAKCNAKVIKGWFNIMKIILIVLVLCGGCRELAQW